MKWRAIVFTFAAIIFCCFPLLNVLGYESSAAMGIVVFVYVMFEPRGYLPSIQNLMNETIRLWIALVPPFLVLCCNAFRVQNCDWNSGLIFWLLIPLVSCFHIVAIRMISTAIVTRYVRLLTFLIVILEFAYFLYKLAYWPSIQGFSLSFGWFAGSIYDEALGVPMSLVFSRLIELLTFISLFLIGGLFHSKLSKERLIGSTIVWCCTFLLLLHSGSLGVRNTSGFVEAELGGRMETPHFIVYYSNKQIPQSEREKLKRDLEFRYYELKEYFKEDPVQWKGRPVEVFIYPDRETQQRLMGSRRTLVARPWTHQMHIRWSLGSNIVAHELAHLFTAPFGIGPLRLSGLVGVIPNLGFIEGIAVAADWPLDTSTPDEVSLALLRNNRLPDLNAVLSPWGFWKQPAGKAYQAMGSFVHWLVEVYTIERFKELYQTSEFYEVYGKDLPELLDEWEGYLQRQELNKTLEIQLLTRYNTRSIFQKVYAI